MTYFTWPGYRTKALTLSYDDGLLSDEKLLSILNRYGIRATFNLNSACMDEERRISRERICELYQGHEIATHGAMHIQMDHMMTGSRNYCRGWGFIMRELQKAQEICHYLRAIQQVYTSADGNMLCNASGSEIYLIHNGNELLLRPGEYKKQ